MFQFVPSPSKKLNKALGLVGTNLGTRPAYHAGPDLKALNYCGFRQPLKHFLTQPARVITFVGPADPVLVKSIAVCGPRFVNLIEGLHYSLVLFRYCSAKIAPCLGLLQCPEDAVDQQC